MIKPSRRVLFQVSMSAGAAIALMTNAGAQAVYPSRAVRVIVPFPPGGGTDIFARLMAQQFAENLKQPFFVENMPGAAGNTGTARAAKAPADGYTVLFAFGSFAVNPSLYERVPYDPLMDFEPVSMAASTTTVLISNPSISAKTLDELIDLVRKGPAKYSYASGGYGTQAHLVGEQIRLAYSVDLVHVPYKGAGPAVADVVAGHVPAGVRRRGQVHARPAFRVGKVGVDVVLELAVVASGAANQVHSVLLGRRAAGRQFHGIGDVDHVVVGEALGAADGEGGASRQEQDQAHESEFPHTFPPSLNESTNGAGERHCPRVPEGRSKAPAVQAKALPVTGLRGLAVKGSFPL